MIPGERTLSLHAGHGCSTASRSMEHNDGLSGVGVEGGWGTTPKSQRELAYPPSLGHWASPKRN